MSTLLGLLTMASVAVGCTDDTQRAREYMPDMVRDPAYKAFAPNPATRDGLTLQRPVAGTIPRGYQPFHYRAGDEEAARAGRELTNPHPATPETLAKGKALYETYCLVCHGEQGKGDGPISSKIPAPPSYTSDRVIAFPPGRIFHVITLGSGKMPSYAAQLSADERWQIVSYVRSSLQGLSEAAAAPSQDGGLGHDPGSKPQPPAESDGGTP
jgi:mono/diheme cytochrome c family protein